MSEANDASVDRVAQAVHRGLRSANLGPALDQLLDLTGARATGLWQLQTQSLRLLGFRAVPDMDQRVQAEFEQATAEVPLDRTGLGIVKAALQRQPAISRVDEQPKTAATSSGWLDRFGARSSVAVPVFCDERLWGVVAVSTEELLTPSGATVRKMQELAERLGELLV